MEVSALRYSGGIGVHARSPLLRLQSDERLIALTRRGNQSAFEVLVARYQSRLLAFCRHLLGSREDAEDVLQEVFAAAFNAIQADDRPINVRPWLYRIARNRSLNHLRRASAIGVDSMDIHFSDNGASTADKVHDREQFRILVGDIQGLPETQRTALILREMDALSYEQIAEAMEQTVPGVKSLLVRARISLAEAAEARQLSCAEVRIELAEVAEGLRRRPTPLVRRHLKGCHRCATFEGQLKHTNRALAALLPIGPLVILKKLALLHLWGGSAGTGSSAAAGAGAAGAGGAGAGATGVSVGAAGAGASAAGATASGAGATGIAATGATAGAGVAGAGAGAAGVAGAGAAGAGAAGAGAAGVGAAGAGISAAGAGATAVASTGSVISGAIATKAAAGIAAAIVTVGAVEASHPRTHLHHGLAAKPALTQTTIQSTSAAKLGRDKVAEVSTGRSALDRKKAAVGKAGAKNGANASGTTATGKGSTSKDRSTATDRK